MYFLYNSACGGNFSGDFGYISSPHWPNNYTNNADCDYRIDVPKDHAIVLEMTHIDLQFSPDCENDSIQVRKL